jgi:hypothetical protein
VTKPTRQVLTIALVTAALCADRAVASSPVPASSSASVAGRLVSRLSVSLKRSIPSAQVYQDRRGGIIQATPVFMVVAPVPCTCDSTTLLPLLTCLPPPVL